MARNSLWCASHIFAPHPQCGAGTLSSSKAWLDWATLSAAGAGPLGRSEGRQASAWRLIWPRAVRPATVRAFWCGDDLGILEVVPFPTPWACPRAADVCAPTSPQRWNVPFQPDQFMTGLGLGRDFCQSPGAACRILGAGGVYGLGGRRCAAYDFVNLRDRGGMDLAQIGWIPKLGPGPAVSAADGCAISHPGGAPWWPGRFRERVIALEAMTWWGKQDAPGGISKI